MFIQQVHSVKERVLDQRPWPRSAMGERFQKQLRHFLLRNQSQSLSSRSFSMYELILLKDREDLHTSHKVIVFCSCTFATKYLRKEERLDKLPGWLCHSLQGHLPHPYFSVSAGLTGATEQKRWHLVSTNEKWQMHKSFRLCRVEISVWHSL